MKTETFRIRIRIVFGLLVVFSLVLVGKLYSVQIVSGEEFRDRADHQYVRPNYSIYDRGSIFFTSKTGDQIPAAGLKSGYTVAINPMSIENPEATYEELAGYVDVDRDTFLYRARKEGDPYEEIGRRVGAETAERISARGIPGVNVYKQRWRYYPGGAMAARSIGFVGYKGDTRAGRYGLEKTYQDVLARTNREVYVNFFAELFSNIKETVLASEQATGDVVTSIDPSVQAFLEKQLEATHQKHDSSLTGGIVIDPSTGDIYALGTYPRFNLNTFNQAKSDRVFSNPLVENVYEMGSIVKALTMAAGLDSGAVTPDTTYHDKGYIVLNGERIENYDGKGRGRADMQTVLNKSLNTGATFVMQQMGKEAFSDYMLSYGLGEKTGVDLPYETSGLVSNLKSTRAIEHATASFGQGVAMSPMATVRALSVLANGGKLITPHLGQSIVFESGLRKNISKEPGKRVLSEEASDTISRMLTNVVDDALAGGDVALDNHTVAAKTGTAQIPHPDGGYYEDRYLHSFFGYAPAFEPRFLVFLYTVEPDGVRYASQSLTDPFMNITKYLINYYDVPPDR